MIISLLATIAVVLQFHCCRSFVTTGFSRFHGKASSLLIDAMEPMINEKSLLEDIANGSNLDTKLGLYNTFRAIVTNKYFLSSVFQKSPFLCSRPLHNLDKAYTMLDLEEDVENDFLEAGRGTFQSGKSGWSMAAVSKPRGSSFADAKLKFEDVKLALQQASGTVVFNSAGGFIPRLAGVCLDAVNAFSMPAAINMYVTNPGNLVSAPPHTDKQDVFVLQMQGEKHWKVFKPPPPSRMPRADPLARGKGTDILEMAELGAPLIDATLSPGQLLYVPAGFPHTTDTLSDISMPHETSLHLTVGIDSHIWGLNWAALRRYTLSKCGLPDKIVLSKLLPETYWDLQSCLPIGFLDSKAHGEGESSSTLIFGELMRKMQLAEPSRFSIGDADSLVPESIKTLIASKIIDHHARLTNIFRALYEDVYRKKSPAKMDLSCFRSQPYYSLIEAEMESLEKWAKEVHTSMEAPISQKKSRVSSKDPRIRRSP